MSNEQQNTRDAAWRQYLEADTVHVPEDALPFVKGYDAGFRDGAASVDRAEIVNEAFVEARRWLRVNDRVDRQHRDAISEAMDAVLEAMEKGK